MEKGTSSKQPIGVIVRNASRSGIGRKTGLSLSGVSRILSGGRNPRVDNLRAVASELGVSMDELYDYLQRLKPRRKRAA